MASVVMAPAPPRSFTIALGAITALGPFAIDTYLSSLPSIGTEFGVSQGITQLTLTGFLLALGLGQFVSGPLTDAFGRRKPLLAGLTLFVLGCVLAAAAPSMAVLIAARVIQGLAGSLVFVVALSSVGDRAKGDDATRLFAALMVVAMTGPIIAPALGGVIEQALGWRAVFVVLAALGLAATALAFFVLPESLPVADRAPMRLGPVMVIYGRLLTRGRFLLPWAAISVAFVFLFSYIGGASYVYQGHYGLKQAEFGLVFGLTGVTALLGAMAANFLASRISTNLLAAVGASVSFSGTALALIGAWLDLPLAVVATGIGIGIVGIGSLEAALMSICMAAADENRGSASGLIGAAQYLLGAASTAAIAVVAADSAEEWATVMALAAGACLILTLATVVSRRRHGDLSAT
jgi:DHA1 family bicyclomycin/chloramphenicol resistance-like MFS transporter